MLRWSYVSEDTYYRDKFVPKKTMDIETGEEQLDYYAFKFLGTELDMYKLMDTNFEKYIEKRGSLKNMKKIKIPSEAE